MPYSQILSTRLTGKTKRGDHSIPSCPGTHRTYFAVHQVTGLLVEEDQ